MDMNKNFIETWLNLSKHKGKWVAFDEKEENIVASDINARKVYDLAIKKGVAVPILFKVPSVLTNYVGSI